MSTRSQAAALSVSGLVKQYGDFEVIKALDLHVERGAIHGLVGLNGSGKTTTIECLLGLQEFQHGEVSLLGTAPRRLAQLHGRVVGIFDSPSLHPNLTVRQCLRHAALLCETVVRSPVEVETLLGLQRYSDFRIKHLSLGNKRRASIAQALLGEPEFIVLDEPFNGLDAEGVDDVLQLITTLNLEAGTSFLLSSHQLPYLEQVCSHLSILHQGRIVRSERIDELLQHSHNRVVLDSPRPEAVHTALDDIAGATYLHTDGAGRVHIELTDMDSAALNAALVQHQVPVAQLTLLQPSLSGLFREITGSGL